MLKVLLAPLRLMVGWEINPRILSLLAVAMLVLLRVTIGWHFYSEGVEKYKLGNWKADPFFANASGPLASHYRGLVWDADGEFRLDEQKVFSQWVRFRERIVDHYGLNEAQQREAMANYGKAVEQYRYVIELNQNDLQEYQLGRERIVKLDSDRVRDGVRSLGDQREAIRREQNQKLAPVLQQIDAIWDNYELAMNRIGTPEQLSRVAAIGMPRPRLAMMDTSLINRIVPYFDIAVGLCLLLGLLTPVAALAAATFLGSVFLSQYPPTTGPASSNYQLIEGMACLVLAATGAGRFAGVDFFLHLMIRMMLGRDRNVATPN